MGVENYEAGVEIPVDDTPPEKKRLENKIGKLLTLVQEVLNHGEAHVEPDFNYRRGEVLDYFDDPEVAEWLDHLRREGRVPFRRFPVVRG